MKKLLLPMWLILITATTMSNTLFVESELEDPGDCAVYAYYAASDICENRPGGCTQAQFNGFASIAMDHCHFNQR